MPQEHLTARRIASLSPSEKREEYWDTGQKGLLLRASPGPATDTASRGSKTFYVRYSTDHGYRRMKLGRYPDTGSCSPQMTVIGACLNVNSVRDQRLNSSLRSRR